MKKQWIILRVVGAVLMTLVLIGAGFGLYHLGWSQGYWMGATALQAGTTVAPAQVPAVPAGPYAAPYFAFHHGFWGMGLLMPLLFVVLILAALRFIFRPFMWAGMGPYMHMHHHSERWGMMHPEFRKWYEEHAASTDTHEKSDKKEDSKNSEA